MIVNEYNLKVYNIAKEHKNIPVLDNVYFCKDGSTVGSDGNTVIIVSPVEQELKNNKFLSDKKLKKPLIVPKEVIEKVLKNIQSSKNKDHQNILNQVDINEDEFTIWNGEDIFKIKNKSYHHDYIPFKEIITNRFKDKKGLKVVVERKKFKSLIESLDKLCPNVLGENPLFLEFTNDSIILRCINPSNNQRVLAVMYTYKFNEKQWLDYSLWEKGFINGHNTISNNDCGDNNIMDNSNSRNDRFYPKKIKKPKKKFTKGKTKSIYYRKRK